MRHAADSEQQGGYQAELAASGAKSHPQGLTLCGIACKHKVVKRSALVLQVV
jgi:hypothetical protein